MPFNMFPYSNLHGLNADWLLRTVKQAAEDAAEAAQSAESIAAGVEGQLAKTVKVTAQTWTAAQKSQARANIGAAAEADIPDVSGVLRYTAQDLTSDQKAQARENIGAVADTGLALAHAGAVVYNAMQELTTAQKTRVLGNIGAAPVDAYVKYNTQSLTDAEKAQARTNIGAAAASDTPQPQDAVLYTAQELTEAQQAQARENILAELEQIHMVINNPSEGVYTTNADFDDVVWAAAHNIPIWIYLAPYGEAVTYIGCARLTTTQGHESIAATLTLTRLSADSLVPETWYNVSWLDRDPSPVLTVTAYQGRMLPNPSGNDAGKVLTVNSLGQPGWEDKGPLVVTFSGTTATITPADNTIYKCGELTSLAISNPPETGAYSIVFTSGSTATITRIPATILGLESFAPEANTIYEINVLDNRAVVGSWAVSV